MTLMKDDSYYHVRDLVLPADDTPCACNGCEWRGTFAQLETIESCSLTPGDPSPAGRCPECESLAYIDTPEARAAERSGDLFALVKSLRDELEAVSKIAFGRIQNAPAPVKDAEQKATEILSAIAGDVA